MNYTKSTAKMKKFQQRTENHILIGWAGQGDLTELLFLRGKPEEMKLIEAPIKGPSRWRRISICTETEIKAFEEYGEWIQTKFDKKGRLIREIE